MMSDKLEHMKSKKQLMQRIEQLEYEGYVVKERYDSHSATGVLLHKAYYGRGWLHCILFFLSFGIYNLLYLLKCYFKPHTVYLDLPKNKGDVNAKNK